MGGDAHDPRDQVGVDPTEPATTEGGDAHEPTLDSEHSHGTASAHVTGGPAVAAGSVAGPTDLDHAIQAATKALRGAKVITSEHWTRHLAQVAVQAAAPVLLHATKDRPPDLDTIWATAADALHADSQHEGDWRDGVCACDDDAAVVLKAAKVEQTLDDLQATRDRLAALEEAARAILETDGSYGQMVEAEIRLRAALDGPAAEEEGG